MKHIGKQVVAFILIIAISVPAYTAFTPRAHATLPVADWLNTAFHFVNSLEQTAETVLSNQTVVKEFVLDGIATGLAKAMMRSIIKSTLNWVATGFEGSPAFVRDLNQTLLQVGDAVVNRFANQFLGGAINSPFGNAIVTGLIGGYYLYTSRDHLQQELQYTLARFSQNPSGFLYGDFSQGGWSAWYGANAYCGNNPYCAQFAAHDDLISQLSRQVDQRIQEAAWGDGFLSWRGDCTIAVQNGQTVKAPKEGGIDLSDGDKCLQQEINTPGSFILDQLKTAGASDIEQLVTADELNEAIAGLLNSLLTKATAGGGLAGGYDNAPRTVPGGTNNTTQTNEGMNLAPALLQGLASQKQQVQRYQAAWATIGNAANAAKTELETCLARGNNQTTLDTVVQPVVDDAAEAATKSATALAAIADLETRTNASAANNNEGFDTIANDFQEFSASSTVPSASDLIDALQQSQTTATDPPSTLVHMQQIADNACHGSVD